MTETAHHERDYRKATDANRSLPTENTARPSRTQTQNPILFTEANEGNEESPDHGVLFVLFVIFCSIPHRGFR